MCDVNEDTNQRPKEAEVTLCVINCLTHKCMYWPSLAECLNEERTCTCTKREPKLSCNMDQISWL